MEFFTPILNPPETGILEIVEVERTPAYKDDQLQKRSMLPMSLTIPHIYACGDVVAEVNLLMSPFMKGRLRPFMPAEQTGK